jgi:hypothetical protein
MYVKRGTSPKRPHNQIGELDISSAFDLGYCVVATCTAPVYRPRADANSGEHVTAPNEALRASRRSSSRGRALLLQMAYIDARAGEQVPLLHPIPTWSFLYADSSARDELAAHARRGATAEAEWRRT